MRGILPERVRLATSKVGLFDHRFRLYAEHRDAFLRDVDQLRSRPAPILAGMFDLDAIRAGIETLPSVAEVAERTSRGMRIIGPSPWIASFALEALILARHILEELDDDGSASPHARPG